MAVSISSKKHKFVYQSEELVPTKNDLTSDFGADFARLSAEKHFNKHKDTESFSKWLKIAVHYSFCKPITNEHLVPIKYVFNKCLEDIENRSLFPNDEASYERVMLQLKMILDNCKLQKDDSESLATLDGSFEKFESILKNYLSKIENRPLNIDYDSLTNTNPTKSLSTINEKELWRLYVDGDKQRIESEQGWIKYNMRESGCIEKMHQAMKFAMQNIDEVINVKMIFEIHQMTKSENQSDFEGVFRAPNTKTGIGFHSLQGYLDSRDKKNILYNQTRRCFQKKFTSAMNDKIAETKFQQEIDIYINALNNSHNSNELKLKAIVNFCSNVVGEHPFEDRNCRVFSLILMFRELAFNSFSPYIPNDPNIFEQRVTDYDKLMEVQHGIDNFKSLIETDEILDIPENLKTDAITKSLEERIEQCRTPKQQTDMRKSFLLKPLESFKYSGEKPKPKP